MSNLTSIRLNETIKKQLNSFALKEKRPKNWIISQALQDFLSQQSQQSIIECVKLECLTMNQQDNNKA